MTLFGSRRAHQRGSFAKRPRRVWRIIGWIVAVLVGLALIAEAAPALKLFGTKPYLIYPAHGRKLPETAVLLSGDIGFAGGMSAHVASALADRGIMVLGVSSPVVFDHQRTQDEARAIVVQAIRTALKVSGAPRVLLIGQSFGADIVATVAPHLPADLLAKVDAVDLMVPGRNVYFRADPTGFAYMFKPDANPAADVNAWRGPPLICIYGVEETDSLCPLLTHADAVIGLPGNHHLQHDHVRLENAALGALHRFVPSVRP